WPARSASGIRLAERVGHDRRASAGRRRDSRRYLPPGRRPSRVVRLRQRGVGAPRRTAGILDRPRPRYPIAGRRLPPSPRLCAPRTVVPDRMALARDGGGPAPGLLEARWRRLATPRLRPVGAAGAAPAGHPRELARGGCLLPVGRSPTADGGRMGGGRGDPA